MEIRIEGRTYQIPDACPIEAPNKRIMRRHLREHGPESFLTSKTLSQFAACVWGDLVLEGAEMVGLTSDADVKASGDSSLPSDVSMDQPSGQEAPDPGNHEVVASDEAIPPV